MARLNRAAAILGIAAVASGAIGFEIPNGAYTGMGIALGAMAHGLLLSEANQRYVQLVQKNESEQTIRAALANQAAPRPLFAVLGAAGSIAAVLIISMVGELVLGILRKS